MRSVPVERTILSSVASQLPRRGIQTITFHTASLFRFHCFLLQTTAVAAAGAPPPPPPPQAAVSVRPTDRRQQLETAYFRSFLH